MQLGEFIKLLQESGIPLTYEVIIAGRSEPRLVEPPPHAEVSKETICIDGLQVVFTDKAPRKKRASAEEWHTDEDDEDYDDYDDDDIDLIPEEGGDHN